MFDLQGHRGARGLRPENTLAAFRHALEIGVATLELDCGVTRDGVVVVSHDSALNPDITRGADGKFLDGAGAPLVTLTYEQLQAFDVGRLRPGSDYAARFPEQQAVDGERIPRLKDLFALVEKSGNRTVRLNIETKIDPLQPALTVEPKAMVEAIVAVIREAGMASRVTIQSFDWRTLALVRSARAGDRDRRADRPAAGLRHGGGRQARRFTLARRNRRGRPWRLGAEGRRRHRREGVVAGRARPHAGRDCRSACARPHGDSVDRERPEGHGERAGCGRGRDDHRPPGRPPRAARVERHRRAAADTGEMIGFLKPAAFAPELPAARVDPEYRRLRRRVFTGIFVGYAGYYLVRNNLALAIPDLLEAHPEFSKAELGTALTALSVAYGISKFLMGSVSDRSNPKYFLPLGLLLSSALMAAFGLFDALAASLVAIIAVMAVNGWVQGMGWPPCGKTMVHWFSLKERGLTVSTWNTAHNVGGALIANLALLRRGALRRLGREVLLQRAHRRGHRDRRLLPAGGHAAVEGPAADREVQERLPAELQRRGRADRCRFARSSSSTCSRTATCGPSRSRTPSRTSCATAS